MISSIIPAHNHIIPIVVFSAQNHNGDKRIHIIPKIIIPVLLIIIPPTNWNFYCFDIAMLHLLHSSSLYVNTSFSTYLSTKPILS